MRIARRQLFEFNDLARAPAWVRDTIVESLSRTLEWGRMMRGLVPPFEEFLAASGADELLDLGSGGGGPARVLAREVARSGRTPPRFLLSDLHPRPELWERARNEHPGVIDFAPAPVDATAVPPALGRGRARTIINVLHHLPPPLAAGVLADAVRNSPGVFVAEAFERNPLEFLNFAPVGLPALLLNPLLSPRHRVAKATFSWITPVALSIALWDGFVSTLRVYAEDELRAMVAPLGAGWRWVYGRYRYPPLGTGYYFYGTPA